MLYKKRLGWKNKYAQTYRRCEKLRKNACTGETSFFGCHLVKVNAEHEKEMNHIFLSWRCQKKTLHYRIDFESSFI